MTVHRFFIRLVAPCLTLAGLTLAAPAAAQVRASACDELVLYNGRIATLDQRDAIVSSVTIKDDRIVAVGAARGVPKHDPCAKVIDLRGRTVVPGLIDSHAHIVQLSIRPGHDMRGIETAFSVAELQQAVRAKAATLPAGEWITAVG